MLDVLNNVPYLPASRCNFSSPVTNQYPDIPAVPAPSALSGDVIKEGTEDMPSVPEGHPGSPDIDPPASDPIEETVELEGHGPLRSAEDWKADALTLRHMMTHLPKNPFCSHCQRAKMENVRLFRKRGAAGHGAEDFGDLVTADTMVLRGLRDRGINGEADAIVFYDLATSWIDVMPVMSRSDANTVDAFNRFAGPQNDIKMMHTDQAKELVSACKELRWIHEWSTPGMPKTNGIIENKVKLVLHGARVILRQAGLEARWWPYATKYFAVARNIENRGGGSAWSKRHAPLPFNGKLLPFGCLVDFFPVAPKPRRVEKGGIKSAPEDRNKPADDDYWSKDEENECVIRIHRTPRKKLFDPRGSNCPIDVQFLADETLTIIKYLNGENDSIQSTTWRNLSDPRDDQSQDWIGETYFQVDAHALERWGETVREDTSLSDDDYEPMSPAEIEEALRDCDYDPLADLAEEESSIAPAVPGEEHDHYKAPKFAPVAKPGVFLGYRFEPGGKWKGDYYVADLEHFQAGVVRPSIHQVKQIYHDAEEPFVFPLLKAYEARTREIASYKHDRLSDPDHPSEKLLPREDGSFSFDEGRFDHGDDEGDRQDRRKHAESDNLPEADLIDLHISDESSPDKRDDYWVRFEEEKSWHRYHVKARKDFFGDDTRPLPSGGPVQADLDDVRITHCSFLDSRDEVYRDSRDVYASGHRVRTHKFWTGVTILFDKGCAPKRRRPSAKKPLCEDVMPGSKEDIDYPQSSKRKERPYTGTGKPNSISSDDWRAMSLTARRIYVSTERELEVEKSRSKPGDDHPGAPAISNKSLLIEFACEADSALSATMFEFGGDAIRVHKDSFDILKSKDVGRLIEIVRKNPKCDLWSSIPCGPWSTWQYVNLSQYGPEFAAELNDARRQSQIMFAAFIRVSREVRKGGGRIAYEWPRHCLGWSQPFMKKFLDDPEILTVNIDGCDFGMKDKNGAPIRKQWRIATNSPDLAAALGGRTCHHEKGFVHARIEGSLTPLTALYPKQMCQVIIKSWYKGKTERSTIPVAVAEPNSRTTWKRDPHALYIHPLQEGVAVPNRGTPESVGLDFQSAHDHTIPAGDKATIGTGLAITIPKGVYGRIAPRSGLAAKHMIDIGAGVIDPDYTGEVKVVIFNHSSNDFIIKKGDKIAQLILERVSILEPIICVQKPHTSERGGQGFGSTDKGAPAASATFPSHMWSSTGNTEWFAMPRGADGSGHSPFLGLPPFSACVARPVPRKEAKLDPKAFAALEKEWKKLRDLGCWDQTRVREWRDVAAEAKREGTKVHVGRIFDICVEKNHELAEDDPNRKFKGRVVFEGCHVRDESNAWALFSEITSCPATMAAGKVADAYGLLPGNSLEVSDGESAYTQALLGGTKTWIRLPRDQWPKEWEGMQDPVRPLVLALYGHPDAGGFWEQHCETQLKKVGFVPIPDWPSVFRHPALETFLVVYVDDFKQSGPSANLAEGWRLIGSVINMEEPRPLKRYLGCEHEFRSATVDGPFDPRTAWTVGHPPSKPIPEMRFGPDRRPAADACRGKARINLIKYNESCFMQACVERYLELCQSKFPKALQTVETPFLDESKPEFDENPVNPEFDRLVDQKGDIEVISANPGVLGDAAAQVLMKILYGARMGRYDLIRPVQALASRITKWNQLCDKKLHRLVSYINSTIELHLYGWVGDRSDMIEVVTYCDADLAGDRTDAKSTSGVLVCLVGPRTYMPITAVSKKQTSVSKSTPEAEIVALDHGISKEAMMLAALWHFAIGRGSSDSIVCKCKIKYDASIPQPISVLEDNEAACRIIVTGNNPNMRYMSRTQRVDIAWLNERYNDKIFRFVACPSDYQGADILTKACVDKTVWNKNLHTLGMFKQGFLQSYLSHPTQPLNPITTQSSTPSSMTPISQIARFQSPKLGRLRMTT